MIQYVTYSARDLEEALLPQDCVNLILTHLYDMYRVEEWEPRMNDVHHHLRMMYNLSHDDRKAIDGYYKAYRRGDGPGMMASMDELMQRTSRVRAWTILLTNLWQSDQGMHVESNRGIYVDFS